MQVNSPYKFLLNMKFSLEKVCRFGKNAYLCIRFQGSPLASDKKKSSLIDLHKTEK